MRKLFVLFFSLISLSAAAQWHGIAGTPQKNSSTGAVRWNFGPNGVYQMVGSVTPGVGFTSHTAITDTGTFNIDTAGTIASKTYLSTKYLPLSFSANKTVKQNGYNVTFSGNNVGFAASYENGYSDSTRLTYSVYTSALNYGANIGTGLPNSSEQKSSLVQTYYNTTSHKLTAYFGLYFGTANLFQGLSIVDNTAGIQVIDSRSKKGLYYGGTNYGTVGHADTLWVPNWGYVKSYVDAHTGGGPTAANPSGLLSFTATNGSSTSYLRADGLHAIDSTKVRSVANSYSLAAMQTKLNNYMLYTDTAGAYANLVHKNGSETVAGNKVFSGTTTLGLVNMNNNIVPTTNNSFNIGDGTHYIGHAYINVGNINTVNVTNFALSSSAVFTQASSGGGKITFQTNSFASDYNWNWPTTGGADSTFLTSAGGGGSGAAMRWTAIKNYGFSRPTALSPAPGANDGSIATARYVDSSFNATATYFTGLAGTGVSGDPYHPYFVSLTTTGTSGPATLSGGVLNIPQYSGGSSYTFTNGVVNSSGTVSIDHTYSNTFTAAQIIDENSTSAVTDNRLTLTNSAVSDATYTSLSSPGLGWHASVWNSGGTPAANYTDYKMQVNTISSSFPYSTLDFYNYTGSSTTPTWTKIASLDRYGIFNASALRGNAVTYANRPTATTGNIVTITDSTVNTWGSTISGGGSNTVLAMYDGTNWTVIGK